MKELDTWDAMQLAFEHYKKDSITVGELNTWSDKYQKDHPDIHVYMITRVDIHHEHGCNRIYLEIKHDGPDIIHKQESVQCSICGDWHYKYPDTEKFDLIVKQLKNLNELENLWSSK